MTGWLSEIGFADVSTTSMTSSVAARPVKPGMRSQRAGE